jgi:hypothetical protein
LILSKQDIILVEGQDGEAGKVDTMQLKLNLAEIRSILKDYPLADIYNMDETALYWRSSPNNSLASKELKGGEADKSRITANLVESISRDLVLSDNRTISGRKSVARR